MKKKLINSLILAAILVSATSFKAYAAVDAYLLKDSSSIYQYDLEELKDSFMNSKIGQDDLLYKEFQNILSKGEFYLIYDNEGKYVSYNELKDTFLEKKINEEQFDLANEVKLGKASEVPAQIETVKKGNSQLTRELSILKDSTTLDGSKISKDKYTKIHIKANNVTVSNLETSGEVVVDPGSTGKVTMDNVKCNLINVLSGAKTGIVFNKVESKEVKIDTKLGIEIQYKDETGSTNSGNSGSSGNTNEEDSVKQAALKQAKAEIDNLIASTSKSSQKQVLQQISTSISQAILDENYDFNSNMTSALIGFKNLEVSDRLSLMAKMYASVDLDNLDMLMDMYNIDKSAILNAIK